MKKIVLTILIAFVSCGLFAQKKEKKMIYSIGVHALIPVDYISFANIRAGASVQAEYKISHLIGLTGSVGVVTYSWRQSLFVDNVLQWTKKLTVLQLHVLAGARFYFNNKIYASGQVGASFFNESFLHTAFTYAPGVGTKIGKKFDVTLRYIDVPKYTKTFSNFDLRFAYNF